MQLAIPPAPRTVRLRQVPGALRRLLVVALVSLGATAALGAFARVAVRWVGSERDFFSRAVEAPGTVSAVALPPLAERGSTPARLTILFELDGLSHTASGVEVDSVRAETLARGSKVTVLVDPKAPSRPREQREAEARAGTRAAAQAGLGLGLLLSVLLGAREWRRAVARELSPLRNGMLVWLTPKGELPQTRAETTFEASYFRQDVEVHVTARARPGRAPVRNGGKVLAAVVPTQPTWVRVIDEDLARTLGWFRDAGPGRLG